MSEELVKLNPEKIQLNRYSYLFEFAFTNSSIDPLISRELVVRVAQLPKLCEVSNYNHF